MSKFTQKEFTTADAIVQELVSAGVEVAFGIVSIHNLPIYQAIHRDGNIHLITARGESGAVNMADGYARATGKLGVVITSTGSGAGNAAGSLVEAWNAGIPLLHITGEIESPYINVRRQYIHEAKDQLTMMEGACKHAYRLRKPEQAVPMIRKSIHEAFEAPTGPVTLEIPIDFQSAIIPKSNIIENNKGVTTQLIETDFVLPDEIVAKVYEARRPVLWAGGGVIKSEAANEIKELAELIGAPVITSQAGKGSIPENHPLCIGYFSSTQDVRNFVQKSDLLISVGTQFRSTETALWDSFLPEDHISINTDINAFNLNYPITHGIVSDAKQLLRKLIKSISKRDISTNNEYLEEVRRVRDNARCSLLETLGPYKHFAEGIREILPNDAVFVRDVTVPANLWGSRVIDTYEPRTSIHAAGGGIGQGLPMAIGAQAGCKDRTVVLMVGDGGFMVNVGEMATAIQENLPIVIILFDDSGYGVLRGIQDVVYGEQFAVDLLSPDFVKLGESIGFESARVGSPKEFLTEFERAVTRGKASLIVVDMKCVGPIAKKNAVTPAVVPDYRPKAFN
ncbi:thiamine pyrophosphate-binding protein [Bacillus sp. FJAT-29790]|uniref:thiamine pyrophosphate-binding protein n=1 Tax=Bacillus sp. FJAT-29790 TaxID=1895002 RepID=UPI001C23C06E|nr:thiamine pyrophosphate-binding protein [Bacillus sp. FJAT-29790]MBU8878012.1 thiamine pyrophosphate-binding protein [Bacillus sp. FJAT-29790]